MQTHTAWELIVIEDGSAGETEEIVRSFAKTVTQRVVYFRHETNQGLPATRNTGIDQAVGEWVAFLDADDLWKPMHLEDLVRVGAETRAAVVCAASTAFDSDTGRILHDVPQREHELAAFPVSLFTGDLIILPSSAMVRRPALLKAGSVNVKYRVCNDTELWFRLAAAGNTFGFTRDHTCLYRRHGGAMTCQHTASLLELARLYDEYADWSAIPRAIRKPKAASLYRYAGRTLLKQNPREARALLMKSLRRDWLRLSTWYYWACSLVSARPKGRAEGGSRAFVAQQSKG